MQGHLENIQPSLPHVEQLAFVVLHPGPSARLPHLLPEIIKRQQR